MTASIENVAYKITQLAAGTNELYLQLNGFMMSKIPGIETIGTWCYFDGDYSDLKAGHKRWSTSCIMTIGYYRKGTTRPYVSEPTRTLCPKSKYVSWLGASLLVLLDLYHLLTNLFSNGIT